MSTRYLSAANVRSRYDNISDMTLWRWLHDGDLGFPQPFRINGRRFWSEPALIAWERSRIPDVNPSEDRNSPTSILDAFEGGDVRRS